MRSLFARRRPATLPSHIAYDAAVNAARSPHWYRQGAVPDTMDGRFSVLATVLALVLLRLENGEEKGEEKDDRTSVAITEAFIADMDAQMREAGFGDPSLGKQVRQMVGSLASRLDRWRALFEGTGDWRATVARGLYRDAPVNDAALTHSVEALREIHDALASASAPAIAQGRW